MARTKRLYENNPHKIFILMIERLIWKYRERIAEINSEPVALTRKNRLNDLIVRIIHDSTINVVDGALMYYNQGVYVPIDDKYAINMIKIQLVRRGVTYADIDRLGSTAFAFLRERIVVSNPNMYRFSNGYVVDMLSGKVVNRDKSVYCTKAIDVPWAEAAEAPMWDAFLKQVLPDADTRKVLQEFMGMCFIDRRYLSIEKLLIMIGTGANGKSVIFDVIKGVLGVDNLSFLDPAQLTDPKQVAFTDGKMINFSPDVKASAAFDSALKSLASAQEVNAWQLFKGSAVLRCPPLVFALNEMPKFLDTSNAFFRRLLIIKFGVTIPYSQQDRKLASKIIEQDAAGVLQWIYTGTRRLILNGGRFTDSAEVGSAVHECQRKAIAEIDVVGDWMHNNGWVASQEYLGQQPVAMGLMEIRDYLDRKASMTRIKSDLAKMGVQSFEENNEIYYYLYRHES